MIQYLFRKPDHHLLNYFALERAIQTTPIPGSDLDFLSFSLTVTVNNSFVIKLQRIISANSVLMFLNMLLRLYGKEIYSPNKSISSHTTFWETAVGTKEGNRVLVYLT